MGFKVQGQEAPCELFPSVFGGGQSPGCLANFHTVRGPVGFWKCDFFWKECVDTKMGVAQGPAGRGTARQYGPGSGP